MVREKFAQESKRFGINWSRALAPNASTILSSAWAIVTGGVTLADNSSDTKRTSVVVVGGTAGETAKISNTVTTSDNQVLRQELVINIL